MASVEIKGETIKSAVAKRVIEAMPSLKVYKEPQQQANKGSQAAPKEAFFVIQRRIEQDEEIKGFFSRRYLMQVRFEQPPNAKRQLERAAEVADILLDALRTISLDDAMVRGDDISYEIVDGVLLIYVTYAIRIREAKDTTPMGSIETDSKVKEVL